MLDSLAEYRFLLDPPWLFGWIALVVLLSGLLALLFWRRLTRGIVPFRAAGGRVEIAPHTIRGVIRYAVDGVEGVENVVVKTHQHGAKTTVDLKLHLLATAPLKICEVEIKRRVRKALSHQFGMEQIDPIRIKVTKVVGDPKPLEEVEREEAEPELAQLPRFDEAPAPGDDYDAPLPEYQQPEAREQRPAEER